MTSTTDELRELEQAQAERQAAIRELQAVRAALEASRQGLALRLQTEASPPRANVAPKVKAKRRKAGKAARRARARARR